MLYLLTQHSQWNRTFHPFLLCSCKRGDIANSNHACTLLDHEEQCTRWNRSLRRWEKKRERINPSLYTKSHHLDWCDEKNLGVSHLGIHPKLLPRQNLRLDTFHLKCAITRKLMNYLRSFLLEQSEEVYNNFLCKVLKNFWNEYHLFVWKNKKNFSSFQGNELALFVGSISTITEYLNSCLVTMPQLQDICKGLELWHSIFKFLAVSYIEEGDAQEYKN